MLRCAAACGLELLEHEARCGRVDAGHARQIDDELPGRRGLAGNLACQPLDAAEREVALQLVDDGFLAAFRQRDPLLLRAVAARADRSQGVARAQRGERGARRTQKMQLEILGQRLARGDAAYAVAACVETR